MDNDEKKAAAEPQPPATYKYKVIERTFKEHQVMLPGQDFESTEIYVSRALTPVDDITKEAVAKRKKEHDAFYKKAAPISSEEAASLRIEVTELKSQLAEAIGALKQAAASKK